MSITLKSIVVGVLVTLFWQGQVNAQDIENIVFEAGSIGDFGTPAASGWQFIETNTNTTPGEENAHTSLIEDVPNRTFKTGTNTEALVLHPFHRDRINSFAAGAEWSVDNDADAASRTIGAKQIVYTQMEIFSDVTGGGQWFKLASGVGFAGNGEAFQGFNDPMMTGDGGTDMRDSLTADFIWDDNFHFNGKIRNSEHAQKQNNTRYEAPFPSAEDLDQTYLSTAVWRQGADAATPFVGTETEVSEAFDSHNGVDSFQGGIEPWGGNTNEITGMVFDRAQVNLLRGCANVCSPLDPPSANGDPVNFSNNIDPNQTDVNASDYVANTVLGIKMFRFGITDYRDVNLDGLVNDADMAIVTANLGAMADGDGLNGPTFYEGDVNNDLVVDQADLDLFDGIEEVDADLNMDGFVDGLDLGILLGEWNPQVAAAMGITGGGAVPEPTSLVLLMMAGTALLATRSNRS